MATSNSRCGGCAAPTSAVWFWLNQNQSCRLLLMRFRNANRHSLGSKTRSSNYLSDPRLGRVGDDMVAPVAAKHLKGGVIRERRQFAQLLHRRAAFFANALGGGIRRIESTARVVRRHEPRRVHSIS